MFDPTKLDLITGSQTGAARLFIVQDQPWTGSTAEIESLQSKIETFLDFVVDGRMAQTYPQFDAMPWAIVIDTYTGPLVLHELRPPDASSGIPTTVRVTRLA